MAAVLGPAQKLSQFTDKFMKELEDDFQSPGSSKFQNYMNDCRTAMLKMEEVSVLGAVEDSEYTCSQR